MFLLEGRLREVSGACRDWSVVWMEGDRFVVFLLGLEG